MTAPDDPVSPRRVPVRSSRTEPLVPPIEPAVVYRCEDPDQADAMLGGDLPGYVYSRDGHPNADQLAELCGQLHRAPRAAVCSSGMAALAIAALSQLSQGDAVIVSDQLYGRTLQLLTGELSRLGVASRVVDVCDHDALRGAMAPETKCVFVETITNPLLRVPDLAAIAEIAHDRGALLVVDNTLASPAVCRPLEWGADLVMESLTKIINGHSDVLLGALCGHEEVWARVPQVLSTWGASASPFDCWLARRGMGTMSLRVQRAATTAMQVAQYLRDSAGVDAVYYPGLADHPDHAIAARQFGHRFGHMVSFDLAGGRSSAEAFIAAARRVPFAPSLGDLVTTLSHPETTSHRGLSDAERARLGIGSGTIRLSVGIEPGDDVIGALAEGLSGLNR